jgi:hypothetical protein
MILRFPDSTFNDRPADLLHRPGRQHHCDLLCRTHERPEREITSVATYTTRRTHIP